MMKGVHAKQTANTAANGTHTNEHILRKTLFSLFLALAGAMACVSVVRALDLVLIMLMIIRSIINKNDRDIN